MNKILIKKILIFILGIFISQACIAKMDKSITANISCKNINKQEISVYENSLIYEDKSASKNLYDILNLSSKDWNLHGKKYIKWGLTKSNFWIYNRFFTADEKDRFLVLGSNKQDFIDIYILDANGKLVKTYFAGDKVQSHNYINFLYYTFKLPKIEQVSYPISILIKLSNAKGVMEINTAKIYTTKRLDEVFKINLFGYSVLLGVFLISLFFGISLFVMLKEIDYLYFAIYVLSGLVGVLTNSGFVNMFFHIDGYLQDTILEISYVLMYFFLFTFFTRYINLKKYMFVQHVLFSVILAIALIIAVLLSLLNDKTLFFSVITSMYIGVLVYFLAIVLYMFFKKLNANFVNYTLMAFSSTLFITIIYYAVNRTTASDQMLEFFFRVILIVNILFVLLSLVYKIYLLERENNISEEETLEKLSQEIKERTKDLVKTNKKLNLLTIQDELTRVGNRRHYNQKINEILEKSEKLETSFALAIIDIDFFKNYNDTYGHIAGDKILTRIVEEIKHSLYNTQAMLFRLGGEEFGIILDNVNLEETKNIFKNIVGNIAALRIENKNTPIGSLTISAGVVVADIVINLTKDKLYSLADSLLYKSKEQGRNTFHAENLSGLLLDT